MRRGTCIVTGGAGFIGCALSRPLTQLFERVIAVDCLHPQVHAVRDRPKGLAEGVDLCVRDVTRPETWRELLGAAVPDVVFHLAAETGTGQSLTEASRYAHTNLCGLAAMLDALAACRFVPERIVLTSSRAVYGNGAWRPEGGAPLYPGDRRREQLADGLWDFPGLAYVPARAEETVPAPVSVYGATKLAQEHVLLSWASAFGTKPIILRLQNVYGPGQSLSNSYTGIVALFCRLARKGQSIPLYEDGAMLRDFILVDDVAEALSRCLDLSGPGPHLYDVGTGRPTTIADLARRIAALYGAPAPHVCGRYRFGDVRHAACMIEKTEQALGWSPRHGLGDGLIRLKSWVDGVLGAEES